MTISSSHFVSVVGFTCMLAAPDAHATTAQTFSIERVSVSSSGATATVGSYVTDAAFSGDGRYVVWSTNAPNLVANDTNGEEDVFLRDRVLGTTECVSIDPLLVPLGSHSGNQGVDVSLDGRFVALNSVWAFAAGDNNLFSDVYVRDRVAGTWTLVSATPSGTAGNGPSILPTLSPDGRFVVFQSDASDLVPGDTNQFSDWFVRDLQSGTTERVSVSSTGAQGVQTTGKKLVDGLMDHAGISADGRYVVFDSFWNDIAPGTTLYGQDIFLRDRLAGTTVCLSQGLSGSQPVYGDAYKPSISSDGRWVAFQASSPDVVGGNGTNIFVQDVATGITTLVSDNAAGALPNGSARTPRISADGRSVWFTSLATNLVHGDTNGVRDIFRRDLLTGSLTRLTAHGIQGDNGGFDLDVSADGKSVLFLDYNTNLVPNDPNGGVSVGTLVPEFMTLCQGTASACPCGNAGAPGAGCDNSLSTGGGRLTASGNALLTADSLVLEASGMSNGAATFIQGTQAENGGAGIVFGDGLRCAGGTIVRLKTTSTVQGASRYPGPGDAAVSVRGGVTATSTRTYQVVYRNAASFCTPSAFNATNGVEVFWLP